MTNAFTNGISPGTVAASGLVGVWSDALPARSRLLQAWNWRLADTGATFGGSGELPFILVEIHVVAVQERLVHFSNLALPIVD